MTLTIRRAVAAETPVVAGLWTEAAAWLAARGIDQWQYPPDLAKIGASIAAGECWLAIGDGHWAWDDQHGEVWCDDPGCPDTQPVGTITVDGRADPDFWTPADQPGDALYAHRMAVARNAAGTGLGAVLLDHAAGLARAAGKRWLRLDAWRDNPGLAAYYEGLGFVHVRTVDAPGRRSGVLFQRPVEGP